MQTQRHLKKLPLYVLCATKFCNVQGSTSLLKAAGVAALHGFFVSDSLSCRYIN